MSLQANEQSNEPVPSTRRAAGPRRARARLCQAGLAVVALLGTAMLVAACAVKTSTQTVGSPINHTLGLARPLAWVNCMRTHGEPNMPYPVVSGHNVQITIHPGDGVDPHSPQFAAASRACKYLTGGRPGASEGHTLTPADQSDYLRAVACMRTHGFPRFPEPAFQNNNVTFNSTTPIDTNSAQYQRALATCDKLIPAGLPYSGRSPSTS